MHASRLWWHDTLDLIPKTFIERFWEKVQKTDNCWNWVGAKNRFGYGILHQGNKTQQAHRFIYGYLRGPIKPGLVVMHSCDNPPCVNPSHLSVGTIRENALDALRKGRLGIQKYPERYVKIDGKFIALEKRR